MIDFRETISTLLKIITYAGLVQGIYSAFVLSRLKSQNTANKFLVILLLILSFSIFHSEFIIPYFHHYHQTSFYIREPFVLMVIPLIWFYIRKLNEPLSRFKLIHLSHFLPFVIVMLFSIILVSKHLQAHYNVRFKSHEIGLNIFLYLAAVGQCTFYLGYMLKLIRNFRIKALNELSNTENIDPTWLRVFLLTFLVVFLLLVFMMIIAIHKLDAIFFNTLVSLVFAITIYVLGYKGLFQQTLPYIEDDEKNVGLKTKSEFDNEQLNKLYNFMENAKPYRASDLTLTNLAALININRNQLSEVINSGTGGNFYDFINKYRVHDVQQMLKDPKFKNFTLLAIAFEAGFSSKSTFNSIFKKYTGLTPSEYRGKIL